MDLQLWNMISVQISGHKDRRDGRLSETLVERICSCLEYKHWIICLVLSASATVWPLHTPVIRRNHSRGEVSAQDTLIVKIQRNWPKGSPKGSLPVDQRGVVSIQYLSHPFHHSFIKETKDECTQRNHAKNVFLTSDCSRRQFSFFALLKAESATRRFWWKDVAFLERPSKELLTKKRPFNCQWRPNRKRTLANGFLQETHNCVSMNRNPLNCLLS